MSHAAKTNFHFSPWLGLPDRFFAGQRQWFPYSQEAIERAHCPCWVAARTQPWWTDRWTYWTETLTCCAAPSDLELPSPIRHKTNYGYGWDKRDVSRPLVETEELYHGHWLRQKSCITVIGWDKRDVSRSLVETEEMYHGHWLRQKSCITVIGWDRRVVSRSLVETKEMYHGHWLRQKRCITVIGWDIGDYHGHWLRQKRCIVVIGWDKRDVSRSLVET